MNIDSLFSHIDQKPESGILYIVGTPIGNLYDISLRALNTLKNVSLVACEDTRQTQKIMNKYSIKNNLISFNMHNSIKKIPIIINQLKKGESIALVSDAGMPSICDPGENLVREVKLNKLKTICIPGPCAALTALVSSGLESSKFIFEGFLPKKQSERNKILFEILILSSRVNKGLLASLAAMASTTLSKSLQALSTKSICPLVIGSKVPGYMAF